MSRHHDDCLSSKIVQSMIPPISINCIVSLHKYFNTINCISVRVEGWLVVEFSPDFGDTGDLEWLTEYLFHF